MPERSSSENISTKQARIAKLAREAPQMPFTTLAHNIDIEWLQEAHRRTRKDGAVGIDGQDAADYAANLDANLQDLLNRAKSGSYKAPPVRRKLIPKPGKPTEKRPIGIPTFEDKVLQRAVVMLMEAVYEEDFLDGSYGFRPGRSAHQALEATRNHMMELGGGWILELDIRKFFDNLNHKQLREILAKRIRDGVAVRLIGKWLNAGVMDEGTLSYPKVGSPQGGVISPLLANIYLHEVLDSWFKETVLPRLSGRGHLVRYADDAVLIFEREEDAQRVMAVIAKRFEKYGLTLHPEKTRLVEFRRPRGPKGGGASPRTFDLLGFTHYWAKSRNGYWVVKRKTARDRYRRALKAVSLWCRWNRHLNKRVQHKLLSRKLRGHYAYYGITGNTPSIRSFLYQVECIWRKWLSRRSDKGYIRWDRWRQFLRNHPLPAAVLPRRRVLT